MLLSAVEPIFRAWWSGADYSNLYDESTATIADTICSTVHDISGLGAVRAIKKLYMDMLDYMATRRKRI